MKSDTGGFKFLQRGKDGRRKRNGTRYILQIYLCLWIREPTGIDLDGEESGILTGNNGEVNLVDFVTLSFGQGWA
jgi:hypothetical protein